MSVTPKSELTSKAHPTYELHDFTSLALLIGCHRTNIVNMIARGDIRYEAARFGNKSNILLITHEEAQRLSKLKLNSTRIGTRYV